MAGPGHQGGRLPVGEPVAGCPRAVGLRGSQPCEHRAAQDLVRVVSSDGTDTGYAATARHTDSIMEHLARVGPSPEGSVRPLLERLGRTTGVGPVVVGAIDDTGAGLASEIHALIRLKPRFGRVVVVAFDRSAWDRRRSPAAGTPRRRVGDPGTALPARLAGDRAPRASGHPGVAAR